MNPYSRFRPLFPLLCFWIGLLASPSVAAKPTAKPVQDAVNRSLSLLQKSLVEYPKHHSCFSCHHQGMGVVALALARANGYTVPTKSIEEAAKHTEADLKRDIALYQKGEGQPGGVSRAGYALLTLQFAKVAPDTVTTAVAGYLLQHGKAKGYWHSPANRPPSEVSAFTDTFLAIRALKAYTDANQKGEATARTEQARLWLIKTPTKDTEDRVFQLWGLKEAGGEEETLHKFAAELVTQQQEDGGWAQLPNSKSDAYATGSVLTVLRLTNILSADSPAYQKGIQYLLRNQQADGSWHVVSRSTPFQPYFESGFPHGKDQFISIAGSGWATSALILADVQAKPPVEIGSRVEMFVDDWLMDTKRNVSLRLNTPVRREVVLVTDKAWEGVDSAYYTVIQDGAKVRLFYRGLCPSDGDNRQLTCYAESTDGIHFSRPSLNLFEFAGSKQNNVIWKGIEAHNFAPFLDSNPHCKPTERFKALGGINSKLYAFASPDGIHWKKLQETPVLTDGAFDSLNTAFWDEMAGVYRCYSRYWSEAGSVRAIQHCTSKDFVHWSKPEPNRYAEGTPYEHFYTNATRPCPGAPHFLLSFPKRFVPERTKLPGYKEPGVSDAVFMSSRDGVNWSRTFLDAWVRPGRDPKNWTQRSNMPASGIVQLTDDEFSIYISEHYQWADNRLCRLTVRKHGFASVHAENSGGEFTTRPLTFTGKNLLLNYATSAAGSVQVEIQDSTGQSISGYALTDMPPLYGDELAAPVTWKAGSDLSALVGKTVRFRFVMKDADLYSLQVGTTGR